MDVEVSAEVSRPLLTLVHIMYLLFFSVLASTTKLASFMFRIRERTETSPKRVEPFYHYINLTTNYQILLTCNNVHRAQLYYSHSFRSEGKRMTVFSKQNYEEDDGRIMKAARKQRFIMSPAPISFYMMS
jgi:hypothetical protein